MSILADDKPHWRRDIVEIWVHNDFERGSRNERLMKADFAWVWDREAAPGA